jgi:DNA polymerase III subunit epsilon
MSAVQPVPCLAPWRDVPYVFIDFETTGTRPMIDRAVEVGLARFERGRYVAGRQSLLDPGMPIPAAVTAIHGIADADVAGMPRVEDFFATDAVQRLMQGAQLGAYNATFDRWFVPPSALPDWTWPWVDALTVVRIVDKFAPGPGRHKLTAACERHGIELERAHRADADARSAGELFFKLVPQVFQGRVLGELLGWMRRHEAEQWCDFHSWLARQPRREDATT